MRYKIKSNEAQTTVLIKSKLEYLKSMKVNGGILTAFMLQAKVKIEKKIEIKIIIKMAAFVHNGERVGERITRVSLKN